MHVKQASENMKLYKNVYVLHRLNIKFILIRDIIVSTGNVTAIGTAPIHCSHVAVDCTVLIWCQINKSKLTSILQCAWKDPKLSEFSRYNV